MVRVERLRQTFGIEIVHRHFPLHPDTPNEGLSLEELFAGRNIDLPASQARMTQLMSAEGLPYGPRTMTYNSRLAQEIATWAMTQPTGRKIHDALFRAYFVDNVNLALIDNLVQIAETSGLPADEARDVLQQRTYREQVDADWKTSRGLGITAVPTFVIDNQGLVGAQSYEQLASLVRSAGASPRVE